MELFVVFIAALELCFGGRKGVKMPNKELLHDVCADDNVNIACYIEGTLACYLKSTNAYTCDNTTLAFEFKMRLTTSFYNRVQSDHSIHILYDVCQNTNVLYTFLKC